MEINFSINGLLRTRAIGELFTWGGGSTGRAVGALARSDMLEETSGCKQRNGRIWPAVDQSGILPCFLGGRVSRFESVLRSAIATMPRV